ncbi:MAG: ribonuclease P protein component [Candidatus Omnitrophota bacterium]|jgi:ribonuclease P protein component
MIPDESLGKNEHILKSADFRKIYKKGFSRKTDTLVLCCLPNGLGFNRIGFSISSRSVKLASSRNRMRRMFKEVYRKKKKDLKAGFDMVIITRKDPGKHFSYDKAEVLFSRLIKSAGVF